MMLNKILMATKNSTSKKEHERAPLFLFLTAFNYRILE